jgi:phospholipase C
MAAALLVAACGSNNGSGGGGNGSGAGGQTTGPTGGGGPGGGGGAGAGGGSGGTGGVSCPSGGGGIEHVVIIVQENHTFDTYFGTYCTAAPGSNPTCTSGASCCEAAPAMEPSGASPVVLDDTENAAFDPNHAQACELGEIDGGAMDMFVTGTMCSNADNFAIAPDSVTTTYHGYATKYAVADRYFQPIAGQSSSNDMYLAVAKEVFIDNAYEPKVTGSQCALTGTMPSMTGQETIASLLQAAGKKVAWYGEGYDDMKAAGTSCPSAPPGCGINLPIYPCVYDPGDVPFLYYSQHAKDPKFVRDYTTFATDIAAGKLPDVAYVKGLGFHSEHPGYGTKITPGAAFVDATVKAVLGSTCYAENTLILVTWDEGGGFFDHIAPPATSTVDNQPYGTRVPLLAIGPFANVNTVSHVQMEHSSIVKFLEFLYLGQTTGQLAARDAVVNNIGSLLDASKTGITIPDQ